MQFLSNNGISYNSVLATLTHKDPTPQADIDFEDEDEEEDAPPSRRGKGSNQTAKATNNKQKLTDTPAIDAFGTDSDCITQEMLEKAIANLTSHLSIDIIKKHEAIRDKFEQGDWQKERKPIGFKTYKDE